MPDPQHPTPTTPPNAPATGHPAATGHLPPDTTPGNPAPQRATAPEPPRDQTPTAPNTPPDARPPAPGHTGSAAACTGAANPHTVSYTHL